MAEVLPALVAHKRPLSGVNVQVLKHAALLGKGVPAVGALVWPFTCVGVDMVVQVECVAELLLTVGPAVGLAVTVAGKNRRSTFVSAQVEQPCETFSTVRTHIA